MTRSAKSGGRAHQRERGDLLHDLALGTGSLEAGLALIQVLLPLLSEISGEPGIDLVRRQVGSRGSGHKWTPLR